MPRRRFTDEEERTIAARYAAGAGASTLAIDYQCDTWTIYNALHRQCQPCRKHAEAQQTRHKNRPEDSHRKLSGTDRECILTRYAAGEPIRAMAREYAVTIGYISHLANAAGLRRRHDRRGETMPSVNIGLRVPEQLLARIDAAAGKLEDRPATMRTLMETTIGLLTEFRDDINQRDHRQRPEGILRRDLARYYALMDRALIEAREALTDAEALAVADALNGILHEPWSMSLLAESVKDSIAIERLAERHQLDGEALVAKLRTLSDGATWALIDAVERWWTNPDRDRQHILEAPLRGNSLSCPDASDVREP